MSSLPATAHPEIPPSFGRIVCGIDGSRSSPVAVGQAIALSGPDTALVFVCVRETRGAGATISAERADAALENAVALAREAGIDAAAESSRDTIRAASYSTKRHARTSSW